MNTKEARALGEQAAALAAAGQQDEAHALLRPLLSARTPFRLLDVVGARLAEAPPQTVDPLLQRIAAEGQMGGWPVIGSALGGRLKVNMPGAFAHCRDFTIQGDVWYATDILGERISGPGLVTDFTQALSLLAPWRNDANRWVRRSLGVAVHLWAKRAHGDPGKTTQAEALLAFLEPLFGERDLDVVKGVGWGLKTLGRYYPDIQANWLRRQVFELERPHSRLMLRKALTYLPPDQRSCFPEPGT